MTRTPTQLGCKADEESVVSLLNLLDSKARPNEPNRAQTRGSERRRLRAPCTIISLARDGTTVLQTMGKSRDISRTGLGLLCKRHLSRKTPVRIAVRGPGGREFSLFGLVVHSRPLKGDWFFVGIRFQKVKDDALQSGSRTAESTQLGSDGPNIPEPDPAAARDVANTIRANQEKCLHALEAAQTNDEGIEVDRTEVISMARSPDHVVRKATIPVLAGMGGKSAIQALIGLLRDPNPGIQAAAADALGTLGAAKAVEPLRELLSARDIHVALRAAAALGHLNDRSGLGVVVAELRKDTERTAAAAEAFGAIIGENIQPDSEGIRQARGHLLDLEQAAKGSAGQGSAALTPPSR